MSKRTKEKRGCFQRKKGKNTASKQADSDIFRLLRPPSFCFVNIIHPLCCVFLIISRPETNIAQEVQFIPHKTQRQEQQPTNQPTTTPRSCPKKRIFFTPIKEDSFSVLCSLLFLKQEQQQQPRDPSRVAHPIALLTMLVLPPEEEWQQKMMDHCPRTVQVQLDTHIPFFF